MKRFDVLGFLEHYGVQGMKWGVRRSANKARTASLMERGLSKRQAKNTVRTQNRIDAQKMAAVGRQGKVTALQQMNNRLISNQMLSLSTVARHPLSTQKAAQRQLRVNKENQQKILTGEKKASKLLEALSGVSIKDLDYDL